MSAGDTPGTEEDFRRIRAGAETVVEAAAVDAALERMAAEIDLRLAGTRPLVLVVLVGGIVPAGRLLPRLGLDLELDYVHATRYRGGVRGRDVHWVAHPTAPLEDRVVLVVDDVLDRGHTLHAVLEYCRGRGARAVYSAVLTHKRVAGPRPLGRADFTGVEVDDRYMFGCGMDYRGRFRHLRDIHAVATG